jgi:hypothetical protein
MADHKLKVVPMPPAGSWPTLQAPKAGETVVITGQGEDNLLCGSCESVLVSGADVNEAKQYFIPPPVLICNSCGNANELAYG